MKKRWISFFCIFFLLQLSCRKDNVLGVRTPCVCIGSCENIRNLHTNVWTYLKPKVQYKAPQFNPMNNDEIIYLRKEDDSTTDIIKYNIKTNLRAPLLEGFAINSTVEWGRSGWMTFSTPDFKIWKIHDSGSELTQLTNEFEEDSDPHFTHDGNKIFFYEKPTIFNAEFDPMFPRTFIMDLNGNKTDSIMSSMPTCLDPYYLIFEIKDVNDDNIFYYQRSCESGFYKFDFKQNNSEVIVPSSNGQVFDFRFTVIDMAFSDGSIYFSNKWHYLLQYDIANDLFKEIKCGCTSDYISNFSISPNGKQIVYEKITNREVVTGSVLEQKSEIWLMDIDGCYERKIIGH